MSDTLTDEHHDWITEFCGVDPRAYEQPADAETSQSAPAPAEERTGGVFDTLSNLAKGAADAVSDAASSVKDAVVDAGKAVADTAAKAEHAVVDAAKTVEQAAVDAGNKAVETAEQVGHAVEDFGRAVEQKVGEAVQAVKTAITGEAPLPPDVPKARADEKMQKLSAEDQKKVQALLDGAKSDKERQYLTKGLAAGHSAAELEEFAKKISGKDEKWLNDNLRLVGDSHGKGIEQQWSYSCGPTTVEAIKGELDPLYALKVREENPNFQSADNADATKLNPKLAEDQKQMLQGGGGVATSRDDPEGKGAGLVFKTLLNKQTDSTGLVYDSKVLGSDVAVGDALNTMEDGVKKGVPVPITVGDSAHPYAHAALVVAVDDGPPRTFTIHDPYYGKTDTFTEDQIKNDQVSVGGWNHVGVVFPPSIKK